LIITHGDLDGLVSALCVLELSGQEPQDVHFFSYAQDRDEKWKLLLPDRASLSRILYDDVWFVDISLRPGELEWVRSEKGNLSVDRMTLWTWADHHTSSREFNPEGIFDEIYLDIEGNKCASDILWDKLTANNYFKKHNLHITMNYDILKSWVEVAHDRDLWVNKHRERNMKLDMILKDAIRKNKTSLLLTLCSVNSPDEIIKIERDAWQLGMKAYENSCKTARNTMSLYIATPKEIPIRIAWTTGPESDVADSLYLSDDDIIVMLQAFPENIGVSFRTRRDDVDLSKIAKRFKGGGHRKASGGILTPKHLQYGYQAIFQDIQIELERNRIERLE